MVQSSLAPVVVLIGRAASGKTTSAETLARKSPVPVVVFGGFIRKEIEENTLIGQKAMAGLKTQGFVPTEIYMNYINNLIQANPAKFRNGFIVEAFPRSVFQVPEFEKFLRSKGMRIAHVFLFNVSKKTSARRLQTRAKQTGREDVLPVEQRQALFDQHAGRLLAEFGTKGMVSVVNSNHLPIRRMTNFFLARHKARVRTVRKSKLRIIRPRIPRLPRR
ncbi:MAG: nucleoside monophosphate kinase [Candidatus Diapherotrites archaeon]|nr:nucleoside monophosphate kinase [Candidatus Diapherotrites archaeon]